MNDDDDDSDDDYNSKLICDIDNNVLDSEDVIM